MIRNRVEVVGSARPGCEDRVVDHLQDLVRGSGRPGLGGVGDHDVRVVDQAGGAVLRKADVDVLVHVLVISHAKAVTEQGVDVAAGHVALLHVDPENTGSGVDRVGLPEILAEVGLDHRDAVSGAGTDHAFAGASGEAVAHIHRGHELSPAAADADRDVSGIGEAGQRGADQHVSLFELGGQESLTGCDTGSVHRERLGRSGHGVEGGSTNILKCHVLSPFCLSIRRAGSRGCGSLRRR